MSSPQPLAQQQRAGGNLATHSPDVAARPTLPARDVTAATIEDAYVRFIFYCNPALPPAADTQSLREAFRNPPRSGGKIFHPFSIFELVRRFYGKEIKTWTELTTRLGVEPPDPTKDESAQKIAQYGVRLKKWMNSMHVKAFFEYLMNIANDYWTRIPNDPNPIAQSVRDGVAVEDDMALRALLPQIRPRRGRKRPDEYESAALPTQRQRLSPPSWPGHPDAQASPLPPDPPRHGPAVWGVNDSVQTPLSRWANSAATPTARSSFWDDALEPQSAVTPTSRPKLSSHRRGAKNVSSAWKSGGPDGGTKTRGRPPINRTPVEPPNPAVTSWAPTPDSNHTEHSIVRDSMPAASDASQMQPPIPSQVVAGQAGAMLTPMPPTEVSSPSWTATVEMSPAAYGRFKPEKPHISLQVPERQGGPVLLATPPPMATVDDHQQQMNDIGGLQDSLPTNACDASNQPAMEANEWNGATDSQDGQPPSRDVPQYYFENLDDRTNVHELISYFTHILHSSEWIDPEGNRQEPAGIEECVAMTNATVEHIYKNAESSQAFLINLAALCGAKMLLHNRPRCYRIETSKGITQYMFDWQYRFGPLKGQFTMTHSVPVSMWKKPSPGEADGDAPPEGASQPLSEAQWQKKYRALMEELEKRDRELFEMQTKVMMSLRGPGAQPNL